eukprot:3497298-Rhodomonas_salina.1
MLAIFFIACLAFHRTAMENSCYGNCTWRTSQPDAPGRRRPPPGLSPMRKGVCATQSTHVFARQSTLLACLTLLPVGETASYEQNLTHLVSQGLWPSYNFFFLAHTSGFLLHSLPCAQDLSVGGKTADLLGSTWPTGICVGLPTCKSLGYNSGLVSELSDNTFAGGLDLTGAGGGLRWDFDDSQASHGLCMVTRKEKQRLIAELDSDSEASASGRPGTRSRATVEDSTGEVVEEERDTKSDTASEISAQMESIAEGMGDATLRTPESHAASQGMANPNNEEEKEADAKERLTELGLLQSRLPFVPQRPLSLDGVTDEEKMEWIPNLRSVIS